MIYSQLIIFMLVIVGAAGAPSQPLFSLSFSSQASLALSVLVLWLLFSLAMGRRWSYHNLSAACQRMEWLALAPTALLLYGVGVKGWLGHLSMLPAIPSVGELFGLMVYLALAATGWAGVARFSIERTTDVGEFVAQRARLVAPALIPYLCISLIGDGVAYLSQDLRLFRGMDQQLILMVLLVPALVFVVPVSIRHIWRCQPLRDPILRPRIEEFLERRGVAVGEILIWPTLGHSMCTAAVLGFVPRWRYILLTPCVVEYLSWEELEAILSHETAHVLHRHMFWYLAMIGSFALLIDQGVEPIFLLFMAWPPSFQVIMEAQEGMAILAAAVPVAVVAGLMVLFFRFVMGFFMRNFERQADLSVLETQGCSRWIISAFHKIAVISGVDLFSSNWHHYGLAERIEFIARAEMEPELAHGHHRKVWRAVALFFSVMLMLLVSFRLLPQDELRKAADRNLVLYFLGQVEQGGFMPAEEYAALSGHLMERGRFDQAEVVLEKGLDIYPDDPELLNNLAWLLLQRPGSGGVDAARALKLAEKAVNLRPVPHILDTYAEALWRLGRAGEAVEVEERALAKAKSQRGYYQRQLKRFRSGTAVDSVGGGHGAVSGKDQ